MPEQRAVVFDVDGVLVDSYLAHYQSWRELGAEYGFERTEGEFAHTFGRTSREILRELDLGWTDQQIGRLVAQKEAFYRRIITDDFPVMPGAVRLIDALAAAGYQLAVGSSGPPENVEFTLRQLGRAAAFSAAVTGADVRRGKPDPEVFQLAATQLGVPPHACAVIEDAAPGIAAARAAGMACVGLASRGHTRQELDGADQVVDHLDQLTPETIGALISKKAEE